METFTCTFPAVTADGQMVDIPQSAWANVLRVAKKEFGAAVEISRHRTHGEVHSGRFVPFPHFYLEATLDPDQMNAFIARINPLIEDVVEHHAQPPLI